ncbi:MAG: hypothetical protein ACLFTT_04925 [Candidatus Hydrogenedentota bacterium]
MRLQSWLALLVAVLLTAVHAVAESADGADTETSGESDDLVNEARTGELTGAFDDLAEGYAERPMETVRAALDDPAFDTAKQHAFYADYFAEQPFTEGHVDFWVHFIRAASGEEAIARAHASAVCAFEALAASDDRVPRDLAMFDRSLGWIHDTRDWLNEAQWTPLSEAMELALDERPLNTMVMLRGAAPEAEGQAQSREQNDRAVHLAMQACLTLAPLAEPDRLGRLLTLPEPVSAFYTRTALFLFDGGALSQAQRTSLASLYAAVPGNLHNVRVLIVPEAIGADVANADLAAGGIVLDVATIPMDALSDPALFVPRVGYRSAPKFTIDAAARLMRVVQQVQFNRRPGLVAWRNAILARAGNRKERYIRRDVPPQAFQANPDDLLPLTAQLWFIDSRRAFFQAMQLLKLKENEALDAVLLLSDVLSGGSMQTLTFETSEAGIVQAAPAAVRRTPGGAGLAIVTGIAMGGQLWSFEMNEAGGVVRYFNSGAGGAPR